MKEINGGFIPKNVVRKLIEAHLLSGKMNPGEEIGLKIDQTLTQDAMGTLVNFKILPLNFKI